MKWENRAWAGLRLNKTVGDLHMEITFHYNENCFCLQTERLSTGRRLETSYFKTASKIIGSYPDLEEYRCLLSAYEKISELTQKVKELEEEIEDLEWNNIEEDGDIDD